MRVSGCELACPVRNSDERRNVDSIGHSVPDFGGLTDSGGPAFWHWGDNGSFKAYMVGFPEQKSGFVMFANSENGLSLADAVVKTALGFDQPSLQWLRHR